MFQEEYDYPEKDQRGLNLRVKGKKRNNIKETKLRNEVTNIRNE